MIAHRAHLVVLVDATTTDAVVFRRGGTVALADEGRKCAGKIVIILQPVLCENYAHLATKEMHIRLMSWKCMADIVVENND